MGLSLKKLTGIFLMVCATAVTARAQALAPPDPYTPSPVNWTGNYPVCENKDAIRSLKHMDLGVRIATTNPIVAEQFRKAMDFWASVLDMKWHEDNSNSCALAVVDGAPELFSSGMAARGQFTDRPNYQGWIAFNPDDKESAEDAFKTAVHEIGHNLGLNHNSDGDSVMYFLTLDGKVFLVPSDLAALQCRHMLRVSTTSGPIEVEPKPAPLTFKIAGI